MDIKNKQLMFSMLRKGIFGNCFRTWYSYEDLYKDGYEGILRFRCSGAPGSLFLTFNNVEESIPEYIRLKKLGYNIVLCEPAPDNELTMNAEIGICSGDLRLRYSTVKLTMRDSLYFGEKYASGFSALFILKEYVWVYEDILLLLELYPNHIVEFSSFDIPVGWMKGRNHCIWEVRLY